MVTMINELDTYHDDIIHDATIDYNGVQLATCSSDQIIKIFSIKSGSFAHVIDLKGHFGPVWQVSWAHPKFGNILASCSFDKRVIIWKENREWTKIHDYKGHEASVNSVSFAPHQFGLTLGCGSSDGSFSILTFTSKGKPAAMWDSIKIKNAHKLGVNAISWGPYLGLHTLLDAEEKPISKPVQQLVTAGCDCLVKIWAEGPTLNNWRNIARLADHSDWVRDVAWSPSLSVPHSKIASCSQDKKVIIWCSKNQENERWIPYELPPFDDAVWNVSWSPTGNILVVSDGTNKVSLWKESANGEWGCVSEVPKDSTPRPATVNHHLSHICADDCYLPSALDELKL